MKNVADRDVEHLADAWAVLFADLAVKIGLLVEDESQDDAAA